MFLSVSLLESSHYLNCINYTAPTRISKDGLGAKILMVVKNTTLDDAILRYC